MSVVSKARVHIPIGMKLIRRELSNNLGRWLLFLVATIFAIALVIDTVPAYGSDVVSFQQTVLARFNLPGYSTSTIMVNNTDLPLDNPSPLIFSPPVLSIAGRSVFVSPSELPGIGVDHLTVPAGLEVFSELVTPAGAIAHVPPLNLVDHGTFYHLHYPGKYNAGIVLMSDGPAIVTFFDDSRRVVTVVLVPPNSGVLVSAREYDVLHFVVQLGQGVYTYAYINEQQGGGIAVVPVR